MTRKKSDMGNPWINVKGERRTPCYGCGVRMWTHKISRSSFLLSFYCCVCYWDGRVVTIARPKRRCDLCPTKDPEETDDDQSEDEPRTDVIENARKVGKRK